jgi:hypothetical protein
LFVTLKLISKFSHAAMVGSWLMLKLRKPAWSHTALDTVLPPTRTGILLSDTVDVPFNPEILNIGPSPLQLLHNMGTLKARETVMVLTVHGLAVLWPMLLRRICGATTVRGHPPPGKVDGLRGYAPELHSP